MSRDTAGIGCDLMFQKMWKQFPDDDIFILHADMTPHHEAGLRRFLTMSINILKQECLVAYYCTLQEMTKASITYNALEEIFQKKKTRSFGSGLILENGTKFKEELELDRGQYDKVRSRLDNVWRMLY